MGLVFVTTHALVGAALGAHIRSPGRAALAGVASHFALDVLPHWGVPDHRGTGRRTFLRVAAVDGLSMLAVVTWVVRGGDGGALAGALGAVAPDLDKPAAELGWQLFPRTVDTFHAGIQRFEAPRRWRVDAVTAAGAVALLAARRAVAR